MAPDNLLSYLDVVHGVFSFSFLRHQGFTLLPQVRAHTLTHGLQPIGNPAEQLVHACQICRWVSTSTHMNTRIEGGKRKHTFLPAEKHLSSAENERKHPLQALRFQFHWNQTIAEFLTYCLSHQNATVLLNHLSISCKWLHGLLKEFWWFSLSLSF